ncbi:hypothetical protein BDA96_07G206900 [Sorghum bicolor]|uniref:Uncharacterized protein n=1 Tax=Sorghum bicolor TaxID=4558 RepID=A0A921QQ78_SORBI|nr:hypothetical protein BDA96_07G206900 [Sorghum bicolor]
MRGSTPLRTSSCRAINSPLPLPQHPRLPPMPLASQQLLSPDIPLTPTRTNRRAPGRPSSGSGAKSTYTAPLPAPPLISSTWRAPSGLTVAARCPPAPAQRAPRRLHSRRLQNRAQRATDSSSA